MADNAIERLTVVWDANFKRLDDKLNRSFRQHQAASRRLTDQARSSASSVAKSAADAAGAHVKAEATITKSQGSIRRALLASASTLAAGLGAREIANLADGYTRFTNQLKVAGLEGGGLASVQERLFQTAQKYGVELEGLGQLYGRLSQGGKELGASNAQLLQFTNGVAAAMKVQGGNAESSRGALLQLSQAMGGAIVRAEEFNSINEGARPLLQAVANGIDRYKGSVSALRADVILGKVTSKEFFQGFLKGSADLERQAAKANLTIGASFTILNNALGKYIGQTDAQLSATARVSQAIALLANNLNTVIPALAVISVAIGSKYVGAAIASAAATTADTAAKVRDTLATEALAAANARLIASGGAAAASSARLTAQVSGQAVAMGVAGAAAGRLGAGILAAFGGPVGLAITAVSLALTGFAIADANAARHLEELKQNLGGARQAFDAYEEAASGAALATGKEAEAAKKAAEQKRIEVQTHIDAAKAKLKEAEATLALLTAENSRAIQSDRFNFRGDRPGTMKPLLNGTGQAAARVDEAQTVVTAQQAELARIEKLINQLQGAGGKPTKPGKDKAAAQLDRLNAALGRAADAELAAKQRLATTAEARAAIELERLAAERRTLEADTALAVRKKELTGPQAKELLAADARTRAAERSVILADRDVGMAEERQARAADLAAADDDLAQARAALAVNAGEQLQAELDSIERQRAQRRAELDLSVIKGERTQAERDQLDLAEEAARQQRAGNARAVAAERTAADLLEVRQADLDNQLGLLAISSALATTAAERRAVELRILELSFQRERAELEGVIASKQATDAEKEIARRRLAALPGQQAAATQQVTRQNGGPLDQFIEENSGAQRLREQIEDLGVRSFNQLADALAEAAGGAKDLADTARNIFRQMIAELLSAQIKRAGIQAAAAIGLPGFASGTNSAPGGWAVVGEEGPEVVNLRRGSQVLPTNFLRNLAQLKTARPSASLQQHFHLHAEGAVMTPELIAGLQAQANQAAQRHAQQWGGLALQGGPARLLQFEKLGV